MALFAIGVGVFPQRLVGPSGRRDIFHYFAVAAVQMQTGAEANRKTYQHARDQDDNHSRPASSSIAP